MVAIRPVEGAFIHAGSATVSTTAEITGMKAAKRAVGGMSSISLIGCICYFRVPDCLRITVMWR